MVNISSNVAFLKALSENNNKPWMDANKQWYEDERKKMLEFVTSLLASLSISEPAFSEIQAKDCLFRINRDMRFSKDKSPYKTNFGVQLNAEGKKSSKGGYYIHIVADGSSFVGGGIWMPEAEIIKKIRQEIDYNWEEFQEIIQEKQFQKLFKDLNTDEKLVRPPKGYEIDNPAIEYLKLKSYTMFRPINIKDLSSDKFPTLCLETFACMRPLLRFLNRTFD